MWVTKNSTWRLFVGQTNKSCSDEYEFYNYEYEFYNLIIILFIQMKKIQINDEWLEFKIYYYMIYNY